MDRFESCKQERHDSYSGSRPCKSASVIIVVPYSIKKYLRSHASVGYLVALVLALSFFVVLVSVVAY